MNARPRPTGRWPDRRARSFNPFRLLNTYGAFGSITKARTEVVLQVGAPCTATPRALNSIAGCLQIASCESQTPHTMIDRVLQVLWSERRPFTRLLCVQGTLAANPANPAAEWRE